MMEKAPVDFGPKFDALDEDNDEDSAVLLEMQSHILNVMTQQALVNECFDLNDVENLMDRNADLRQAELAFINFCREKFDMVPKEFAHWDIDGDLY
jgi:hypothetical protein